MLLTFLIALIIITVIATFPTFWIRLLARRVARARGQTDTDTHDHSDS